MSENSDVSNEICTNQLLSIPIDGRWMWDEKTRELVYQNLIQNKKIKENHLKINEKLKIDIRTGIIHYRKQSRPFQKILKTKNDHIILLIDVIQASLNVMSEIFYIPIEFEEYLKMPPVQDFLLYLLNYFYWFFETMNNAAPKLGKHIDRSDSEKSRIRISYAHLLAALRELTSKYTVLLLGINLKTYHHMRNGDLFYSCDNIDRTIYESLWIFSNYFIWITFYRQYFELIRHELARLFRAGGDIDVLKIPSSEKLENRIRKDDRPSFSHKHKLIDCTELFTESLTKKAIPTGNSQIDRLTSFLVRDFPELEENNNRFPYYHQKHVFQRRNRIRGILTKQLKSRNQSLVETKDLKVNKQQIQEKDKLKQQHQTIRRLLNSSFHQNISILPIPKNPLDNSKSRFNEIQFDLKQNIGILGKSFSDFDSIRLILKPMINNDKLIPNEYLVRL